jgi:primary-amine oxidase
MLGMTDSRVADEIVRADPRWAAAIARRGVTNANTVVAGAWSAGFFGDSTERGRIVRVIPYLRERSADQGFLRPIEGVMATVNLTNRVVTAFSDVGVVPVPRERGFHASENEQPLNIDAARAPIRIDGGTVRWRQWRLHVAPHPREGVVLHHVAWLDGTRERSVLYRASVSEMVVPYGDPDRGWFVRNAIDAGEFGLGQFVVPLRAGVEVPNGARFLSATLANEAGVPVVHPRAIAVYERDGGLAWRYQGEARRARELVVEWIASVGNYEYAFAWILHEDGVIEQRTMLTGIMSVKGAMRADAFGQRVTDRLVAPHHQHFFAFRLDTDIDGSDHQRVIEVEAQSPHVAGGDSTHAAMTAPAVVLNSERQARRFTSGATARRWVVQNMLAPTPLGDPVGMSLVPGENARPIADSSSWIRKRAGFLDAQLWVTPYRDGEWYAAGEYPNQSRGGDGLPAFTRSDANVADTDVVLWYVMGITHIPRPEDWPVMPVHVAGFRLLPTGFFPANPLVRRQTP